MQYEDVTLGLLCRGHVTDCAAAPMVAAQLLGPHLMGNAAENRIENGRKWCCALDSW